MSATWAINGIALAELGLQFVGGTFNTGTRSVMTLRKTGNFTAAEEFPWGTPVTLMRNGQKYFQGKVNSLPHSASENDESQEIQIVDAWQDLEETIYKESWNAGPGSVMLPIAILGRKSNGAACTDAEQIQEAVAYAATAGVAIQMGSIPAGLPLWQSEVRNVAVAEVIRVSLRFHPDWVPWLDHTTTPPTLNFTPRASMTLRTIDIGDGDATSVSITRRDDLKPDAVHLLYLNATIIDGVTYRDWIEDKFPAAGPSAGPRVVSNIIELAGGQMQFQKQRVQTRDIPSDHDECREWLKKKFPQIKDIPDDKWAVRMTAKELVPEHPGEEKPHPINPRATRLTVTDVDDLPRELVAGSIEDWMRRKVGRVNIGFDLRISPAATAAERKLLEPLASMRGSSLVATNAITKIYKGITQWVEPEDAPVGIAAAIYNGLSVYQYEGSITTVMEDVSGERFHGCRLNVTGGRSEWAGMNAMVHSVSFDIATGSTTISVGPAPFLAAADMLELQRLLRGRKVTWMSENERTSNELGAESAPGSKGDTVGGFDGPGSEPEYHRGGRFIMTYEASTKRLYVSPGAGAIGPDPDDNIVRPKIATIDDDELTESPAPYLDCSGKTGTHELVCFMHADKVELMLKKQDDPEDEGDGDGEGFLIGTITFTGIDAKIEQIWESDIPWPGEDSSSSAPSDDSDESGGGGPPDSGGGSDESGESKDTAIVPAPWSKTGYVALYAMEAPDVRFEDVMSFDVTGKTTRRKIDRRFAHVCEAGTIEACSFTIDQPVMPAISIKDDWLTVRVADASEPARIVVKLSGIRRGFLKTRFGLKTREQFEANERRLKGL